MVYLRNRRTFGLGLVQADGTFRLGIGQRLNSALDPSQIIFLNFLFFMESVRRADIHHGRKT